MYLTWKKGSGEWNKSETKPSSFSHDCWGPFKNILELKMAEFELRALSPYEVKNLVSEMNLELEHALLTQ